MESIGIGEVVVFALTVVVGSVVAVMLLVAFVVLVAMGVTKWWRWQEKREAEERMRQRRWDAQLTVDKAPYPSTPRANIRMDL